MNSGWKNFHKKFYKNLLTNCAICSIIFFGLMRPLSGTNSIIPRSGAVVNPFLKIFLGKWKNYLKKIKKISWLCEPIVVKFSTCGRPLSGSYLIREFFHKFGRLFFCFWMWKNSQDVFCKWKRFQENEKIFKNFLKKLLTFAGECAIIFRPAAGVYGPENFSFNNKKFSGPLLFFSF